MGDQGRNQDQQDDIRTFEPPEENENMFGRTPRSYDGRVTVIYFWSPTLSLEIRTGEDGATALHGLFGPHPAVWTFFMFVHFASVTGALIGVALAWSQWSLDETAWGVWSLPAAGIASGAAYAASLFGQRLARDEMASMLALVDRVAPEANATTPDPG